jgi:hypothetical protein
MHAHDIEIEEWWLYWFPNYVSIIVGTLISIDKAIAFSNDTTIN